MMDQLVGPVLYAIPKNVVLKLYMYIFVVNDEIWKVVFLCVLQCTHSNQKSLQVHSGLSLHPEWLLFKVLLAT